MKRITVILIFILVFASILISCNNNPSKKNNDNTPIVVDDVIKSKKNLFVNPGTDLGTFGTELISRFPNKAEQFSCVAIGNS